MTVNIIVAKYNDEIFNNYLAPSINKFKVSCYQIGNAQNNAPQSVPLKYNTFIDSMKTNNKIQDDDIYVFLHEDTNIIDNEFINKLELVFENPEIGIVGTLGTEKIQKDGWWLDNNNNPVGHRIEGIKNDTIGSGNHKVYRVVGYFTDIVAIDNMCMAIRGSVLKNLRFNDNDMYAMDFCIEALQQSYKIAVVDILLYHLDNETMTSKWEDSKQLFNEKHKDLKFPITTKSFKYERLEVMDIEL